MADDESKTLMIGEEHRLARIRLLKILAALVWYLGGIILLYKGVTLLIGSVPLFKGSGWPWVVALVGFALGAVKGRLLFSKTCRKNLRRISGLAHPRVWQFFSPGFFLLLLVMIAAGILLSRLAHTSLSALIGVVVLDLAVGTALLASSRVFWQSRAFAASDCGNA